MSKLPLKKLLVPTDFSDISLHALDYAAGIANNTGAEITLLHVYDAPEIPNLSKTFNMNDLIEKGINEKINEIKISNKNLLGVFIHSKVVNGNIHDKIEAVAKEIKADLIVMGTHGSSGIRNMRKFILGSTAYRVVSEAPCPIITLREVKKKIAFKNIVLPIDNSKDTMKKVGLAIEWAKAFGSTVHILALTAFFEELVVQIKDLKEQVAEVVSELEKNGIKHQQKMIRHQRVSDSVHDYAKKVNADLIMIATGQENAFTDAIFHSAARNIVTDSSVPVLSVNTGK
ncbi:MAG TPA: hypothetical protein DCQ93_03080 [Bacteroidetes bacterium]|nr:hypothetical protein [Bacteroidota bacterium]